MTGSLATLTLLAAVAVAEEGVGNSGAAAVAEGQLSLVYDDGTVLDITAVGVPEAVTIDPKFRTCRTRFAFEAGTVLPEVLDGCHPNLRDAVVASSERWTMELSTQPRRDREMLEVWSVFPDTRGAPVRQYLRQRHDVQLTATTRLVKVLPMQVVARKFFDYPIEAVGVDTTVTQCDVNIDVSGTGVPHAVNASRCDEVFRAAAEEGLKGWRFHGNQLDGVPFQNGFTLGVRFTREYDREDGLPGKVTILFPDDPELGIAGETRLKEAIAVERVAPREPTWPAVLVMDHGHYAQVGIYEIRWPTPLDVDASGGGADRRCPLLFQTNSTRLVWAWAEEGCDPEVRAAAEQAGNSFNLKHGTVEKGERYARFRGTFVFPADGGHVRLEVPASDLESPARGLPDHVHTYDKLKAIDRIPPKLPVAFATEVTDSEVTCRMRVEVGQGGRAEDVVVEECPESYAPYALKAVKKWKWDPARRDGRPVTAFTVVQMRFDNR